jgi:hypothetical protein
MGNDVPLAASQCRTHYADNARLTRPPYPDRDKPRRERAADAKSVEPALLHTIEILTSETGYMIEAVMSKAGPQLTLSPRQVEARATTRWDAESRTLRTELTYASPPARPFPSISERLDRELGVRTPTYRVILGELEVVLRDGGRWESLEIRTNPDDWVDASLPDVSGGAPPVWAEFRLAFDDNNVAAARDATVVPVWDGRERRLSLRLELSRPSVTWSALADTVTVGVDDQGRLSEVRLDSPLVTL